MQTQPASPAISTKTPGTMNNYAKVGKWMFALTFIMGGVLHVTGPAATATQVPTFFGAPYFWVYLTGLGQLAFAASILLEKYDKLASVLLFVMMVTFIVTIHIPKRLRAILWESSAPCTTLDTPVRLCCMLVPSPKTSA